MNTVYKGYLQIESHAKYFVQNEESRQNKTTLILLLRNF